MKMLCYVHNIENNDTEQVSIWIESIFNLQITPVEEMESKYERCLCMSLISYAKLLDSIGKINEENHRKLFDSPKFWKLSKNKERN